MAHLHLSKRDREAAGIDQEAPLRALDAPVRWSQKREAKLSKAAAADPWGIARKDEAA